MTLTGLRTFHPLIPRVRGNTHLLWVNLWRNLWHCTINKMASVCGTRGKRSVSFFAALNITSFYAESTPRRRTIDSGHFFEVGKQSWLAELRQNFAPMIGRGNCFGFGFNFRQSFENRSTISIILKLRSCLAAVCSRNVNVLSTFMRIFKWLKPSIAAKFFNT